MEPLVRPATARDVRALRTRHRHEMDCQIVHDSLHERPGWTQTYLLTIGGNQAAFAGVAVAGPWQDKPTIFEFYVHPDHRDRAFDLFAALLTASGARLMEIQSNDTLLAVMLHTYARDIWSEKIVFRDGVTTALACPGATLRQVTTDDETRSAIAERAGGTEWVLEMDGTQAGKGGVLFHYNRPYGDVYMEVDESFRRRGLGAYLVQELKRVAYQFGAIPAARCSPDNVPSRKTLQKAGLVPYAHILNGTIPG